MILYNSATHQREEFVPNEPGKVSMYTCGPTVYHFAHIGNLRTYIMEDILDRYLRYSGYDVKRVMNITDVGHLSSDGDTGEDKMLKGAKREKKSVMEIAEIAMKNIPFDAFDEIECEYLCDCSRERMLKKIRSLQRSDIVRMLDEQQAEGKARELTAVCRFCDTAYTFDESALLSGKDN